MHELARAIAALSLLAPLGASALGVGDLRLHSGLNQSVDAEIPLVLSGTDSLSDVRVGLASPETFSRAGIDRHYFLTKLQFSPIQKPDGRYAIRVTSREAMREPFLNFLVEVNWPQGRVVREFTALLDPPASMPDDSYAEITPPEDRRPVRPYAPRERIAEISHADDAPPPIRKPARRTLPRTLSAAPQPAYEPMVPAARPKPAVAAPSANQLTDDAYGPVQRGETLSGIANALAENSGVTPAQAAAGLYRANPRAFSGGMNSLRAGAVLRIPTAEYMAQLAPGRIGHRSSPALAGRQADVPQNQLKLLAPPQARGRGNEGGAGTKAKSDLALEVMETVKQENEEFRAHLRQLEQKLGEMQRQISIKNEEIATLQAQKQPGALPPVPTAAPPALAPKPLPQTPAQNPPAEAHPPTAVRPPAMPVAPATTPVQAPIQAQQPPEGPAATARPSEPAIAPPLQPPATVPPAAAPPKPVARTVSPPPTADEPLLPFEWPYLLAGVSAALLGLGAWLVNRRRNAMIAQTESILHSVEQDTQMQRVSRMAAPPASVLEPVLSTKSSFLSEFTPSDFDALGTEVDDVDPISEADVYLAYGRYKQAEELMRHAIAQHPERDDCKLKLLEIYQATDNRAAFESYSRELKSAGKEGDTEFWSRVTELGADLEPAEAESPPQPQRERIQALEDSMSTSGLGAIDHLSDDLIDDLKHFETDLGGAEATGDLDFAAFDLDSAPAAEADRAPGEDFGEFDIASIYKKEVDAASRGETTELSNPGDLLSFDFRPAPSEPEAKAPPQAARPEKSFEEMLFDFGDLDDDPPADASADARPDGDQLFDKFGLDLSMFAADPMEDGLLPAAAESGSEGEGSPNRTREPGPNSLADMDFDLRAFEPAAPEDAGPDPLEITAPAAANRPAEFEEQAFEGLGPLDFDFGSIGKIAEPTDASRASSNAPASWEPIALEPGPEDETVLGTFGFDLELLEPGLEPANERRMDVPDAKYPLSLEAKPELPPETATQELGGMDFDLGLALTEAEPAEEGLDPLDQDFFGELTDMDPCETKLDLAKAYADMEDEASAREILLEVATAGNERQKAEAALLLSKLRSEPGLALASSRSGRG